MGKQMTMNTFLNFGEKKMASIVKPGTGILFMKVGTHANEPLADIITRKKKEIQDAGCSFWGYGGNTCHQV